MARSIGSTDGLFFVPALAGLGTPHWEPEARGTILGISRGTRVEHVVRAALEAMAYSTAEALTAMSTGSGLDLQSLRADGGAARNDWLMQFQADVLSVPVRRPEAAELTAIGAAGLAGIGAGVWSEPEEFLSARGPETVFEPDPAAVDASAAGMRDWHKAVRAALHWARDPEAG